MNIKIAATVLLWFACMMTGKVVAQTNPSPSAQPERSPTNQPDQPTIQPVQKPVVQPTQKPATQDSQKKPANQRKQPPVDEFPPNPLEITEPDPLIPYDYKERPLTAQERKEIAAGADRLNATATAKLQKGDRIGAFADWNRELRFRRLLGSLPSEVLALGRVGDIAWRENEQPQIRYITQRLDEILAQTQKPATEMVASKPGAGDIKNRNQLLEALGLAYQQVRLPKTAAGIYQQLLAEARQRNDSLKIEATLITLGQLHMSWFNYADAAKAYGELLDRAKARKDVYNTPIYLTQLAYIHEQAKQPEQAIPYQQQLVEFYQSLNDPKPIPALKVKIADNYRLIERLDLAEANYQLAYQLAQPLLQLAYAGDALKKLGEMYRANNRLPAAVRVYDFLVGVEQQAYNTYGVMNAYDQLGQVHLLQKEYPRAIAAFQRGLAIARQLKFREDYFNTQIQQASQQEGARN
ncbi:MAG: tetratricopeptide repeat protein [Leptolyngbyaceae cyanobacterium RU_5_1]|nr:tetratricopeptide repeat protein [Leptolyngbyaceae cyanobacterium RU_5_1]